MLDGADLTDARKAFLEERKKGVGSTMSPVILGLARFSSPFQLWQELTNRAPEKEQTLPMWLGLKMQATLGELYAAKTGLRVRADNRMHTHPHHPWLYTHLDFRTVGTTRRLVEVKTSTRWDLWGPEGGDDVPPDYWVQVQHEMACTGYREADLAVLLGNREFRVYTVGADAEFQARMIDADYDFWHNHVLADVPPYDGSAAAEQYLRQSRPAPTEGMKVANAEQTLMVARYEELGQQVKALETEQSMLRQRLELAIGEYEGIYGPGFVASWRKNRDSEVREWPLIASTYAGLLRQVGEASSIRDVRRLLADNDPETIASLYTTTKTGPRVFRVSRKQRGN